MLVAIGGNGSVQEVNIPQSELDALYDLYNSTNGEQWDWNQDYEIDGIPWDFSSADPYPCRDDWQGISCTSCISNAACYVTRISLAAHGLKGELPPSLSAFSFIEEIDLGTNFLFGKIPPELGSLQLIRTLSLERNELSGRLPDSIGNMSSLATLRCHVNHLTGGLPSSMFSYPLGDSLEFFDGGENMISGSLPASIGNASALLYLRLTFNAIEGTIPEEITGLTKLQDLDLSNNLLVGSIPRSIGRMKALSALNLAKNGLVGTQPEGMYAIEGLTFLQLRYNQLSGSLPADFGQAHVMLSLNLEFNELTGTIPDSLCNLTTIVYIYLYKNSFTGHFPDCFEGKHGVLHILQANDNFFTGSLPGSLINYDTHSMRQLLFYTNSFSGELPPYENYTKPGPDPDSVSADPEIVYLDVSYNYLSGSVSPSVIQFQPHLQQLSLQYNMFTGYLSRELFHKTPTLTLLFVEGNYLSGNIAELFPALPVSMRKLNIGSCLLSGTLPSFGFGIGQGNNSVLEFVDISANFAAGSVPPTLWNLPSLAQVNLSHNSLSGSLELGDFNGSIIDAIDLSSNSLTGSLPLSDLLHGMPLLRTLILRNNRFGGILVDSDARTTQTETLIGHELQSSESVLPADFAGIHNRLSSSIVEMSDDAKDANSTGARNVSAIQTIDISNNAFTGSLPSYAFVGRPYLASFAAVGNCFEGTLPEQICDAEQLRTLALDGLSTAATCRRPIFRGMDGLTGSKSGGTYVLSPSHSMRGSIPPCLFSMPHLQTLHLSGNGLTGSIPADLKLAENLTDLSLSDNLLTHTIPTAMQQREWEYLDLGFNRLTGTLDGSFPSSYSSHNSSLFLLVNRLSGKIPFGLFSAFSIQILRGNIFQCPIAISDSAVPQADPEAQRYECGSNFLNVALSLWAACVVLALLIAWGFLRAHNRLKSSQGKAEIKVSQCEEHITSSQAGDALFSPSVPVDKESFVAGNQLEETECERDTRSHKTDEEQGICPIDIAESSITPRRPQVSVESWVTRTLRLVFSEWLSVYSGVSAASFLRMRTENIYSFGSAVRSVRLFCVAVTVYSVIVLLPAYVVLTYKFGTYKYQYAWTASAVYLSGITPSLTLMLLLCILGIIIVVYLWRQGMQTLDNALAVPSSAHDGAKGNSKSCIKYTISLVFVVAADIVLMMAANSAYVYATINADQVVVGIVAVMLSAFKVLWNLYVLEAAMTLLSWTTIDNSPSPWLIQQTNRHVQLRTLLVLFNNLIAPCIAIFFVSADCFYYAVQSAPKVEVSYTYTQCGSVDVNLPAVEPCDMIATITSTLSYPPPFTYRYQCSGVLLTSYAPIYVYMSLFDGLFLPIFFLVVFRTRQFLQRPTTINIEDTKNDPAVVSALYTSQSKAQGEEVETPLPVLGELSAVTFRGSMYAAALTDRLLPSLLRSHGQLSALNQEIIQESCKSSLQPFFLPSTNRATLPRESVGHGDATRRKFPIRESEVELSERDSAVDKRNSYAEKPVDLDGSQYCNIQEDAQHAPRPPSSLPSASSLNAIDAQDIRNFPTDEAVSALSNNHADSANRDITLRPHRFDRKSDVSATSGGPSVRSLPPPPLFFHARFVSTLVSNVAVLYTYGALFPPLALAMCFQIISTTLFMQLLIGRFVHQARTRVVFHASIVSSGNRAIDEHNEQDSKLPVDRNDIFDTKADSDLMVRAISALNMECKGVAESLQQAVFPLSVLAFSMYGFFLFDTLGDAKGAVNAVWILFAMAVLPLFCWIAHKAVHRGFGDRE